MRESIFISFIPSPRRNVSIISKDIPHKHLDVLTVGRFHAFLDGTMKLSTLGREFVLIFDEDKGRILGIEFKVGAHFEKTASLLGRCGTRRAKGGGRRGQQSNCKGYGYGYCFSKHNAKECGDKQDRRTNLCCCCWLVNNGTTMIRMMMDLMKIQAKLRTRRHQYCTAVSNPTYGALLDVVQFLRIFFAGSVPCEEWTAHRSLTWQQFGSSDWVPIKKLFRDIFDKEALLVRFDTQILFRE